jgi:hypothetical protein
MRSGDASEEWVQVSTRNLDELNEWVEVSTRNMDELNDWVEGTRNFNELRILVAVNLNA